MELEWALVWTLLVLAAAPLWYRRFKWSHRFFHNVLHWHDGEGSGHGFDGASCTSVCSYCGKRVLQDSQGNWFTATG